MKKLTLAAFAAVLFPTLVLGQGQVWFASVPTTAPQGPYQRVWLASTMAPAGVGTTAQLWWSPDNVAAYTPITDLVPVSDTSGRITTGAVVAITGWETPGGANAWFKVYGENLGLGVNGWTIGFVSPTTNPADVPPSIPPFLTGWDSTVGQVLMTPVPEPSAITLGGLGIGALLLFRWLVKGGRVMRGQSQVLAQIPCAPFADGRVIRSLAPVQQLGRGDGINLDAV